MRDLMELTDEELDIVVGGALTLTATNVNNGSQGGAVGGSGTNASTNGVGVTATGVGTPPIIGNPTEAAGNNVNSSGGNSTLTVTF